MRRFVLIVVAIASLAVVAAPSASARHTLAHRVSALETKVNSLQRRLTRLERFVNNCVAWRVQGFASYGDPNGAFGFVFDNDGPGVQPPIYTSALDFPEAPADVDVWVPSSNPACVASGRIVPSGRWHARPARLR